MAFALTQRAYRFYNDDGSETTATAAAAENTNLTVSETTNTNIVLRVGLQESGSGSFSGATTDDFQLQYSKNGGAYTNITTSSSNVKGFDSTNLTDAGTTTNRLSAGTGSFVAGEISESGLVTDRQVTANNYTEMLYTLTVVAADVAANDTLDFRVLLNGGTITYSVTPRITASNASATSGVTLNSVTVAATGQLIFSGTATIGLSSVTSSSSGTHTQAADGYFITEQGATGDKLLAEDNSKLITEGAIAALDATSAIALNSVTVSATGALIFTGTAAITLAGLSTSSAGAQVFSGTSAIGLNSVTVAGVGLHPYIGTAAIMMPSVTSASTGAETFSGTSAIALSSVTSTSAGKLTFTGTAAIGLSSVSAAGAGAQVFSGTSAMTLPSVTSSGAGSLTFSGTGNIILNPVTVLAAGKLTFLGTSDVTLPSVTVSAVGEGGGDLPVEEATRPVAGFLVNVATLLNR